MSNVFFIRNSRIRQRRWGVKTSTLPLSEAVVASYPKVGEYSLVDQSVVEISLKHAGLPIAEQRRLLADARDRGISYESFCAIALTPSEPVTA